MLSVKNDLQLCSLIIASATLVESSSPVLGDFWSRFFFQINEFQVIQLTIIACELLFGQWTGSSGLTLAVDAAPSQRSPSS